MVGHPLDTVKALMQTRGNSAKSIAKNTNVDIKLFGIKRIKFIIIFILPSNEANCVFQGFDTTYNHFASK